jgi:hypothetical protein
VLQPKLSHGQKCQMFCSHGQKCQMFCSHVRLTNMYLSLYWLKFFSSSFRYLSVCRAVDLKCGLQCLTEPKVSVLVPYLLSVLSLCRECESYWLSRRLWFRKWGRSVRETRGCHGTSVHRVMSVLFFHLFYIFMVQQCFQYPLQILTQFCMNIMPLKATQNL